MGSVEYYKLPAEAIFEDIKLEVSETIKSKIEGIEIYIDPDVYPSQKFRTTSFLLNNLEIFFKDKKVCDMGCGPGIVGLYAMIHGAKQVVQADINPHAVENAIKNNKFHKFTENQIQTRLSDCFDNIESQIFDLIIFNVPFHCENVEIDNPLKLAFFDPEFSTSRKFLTQAKLYSDSETKIFIAFSNKGNVELLESIFNELDYNFSVWKISNQDQEFDNRIYLLSKK